MEGGIRLGEPGGGGGVAVTSRFSGREGEDAGEREGAGVGEGEGRGRRGGGAEAGEVRFGDDVE